MPEAVFVVNETLWCLVLVWFASAIGSRLRRNAASRQLLQQAAGAPLVKLGVRLAVGG